ncbi:MAG: hypothetical protein HC819_04660 [Cyclobacteriaceae bacterium]|nr:hypothetical protein [Cyclobacteriaceae bacterium]
MKYILLTCLLFLGTNVPPLNQKVVDYLDTVIGKKVDRGECWDLAAAALDHAGAFLDRSSQKSIYVFGKVVNPKTDEIFAGDIIQLENVKLEYTKDDGIYTENMAHHTAIVYKVLDKNHFEIAHQNTSFSGKKVGVSEFKLSDVKKGKIIFYRPVKK